MKQTPLPIVSGRYFLPNAPLLCLKRIPACAVTSVNSMGPDGRDVLAALLGPAESTALLSLLPFVLIDLLGSGAAVFGDAGTLSADGGAGTTIFAGDRTSGGFGGC
jgi:hypothetical protein